jgi:vacuolar-type H+-ATPase subunit I/STV1
MAVSRMRKVHILAHKSAKADVIAALREGGVLHISEPSVDIGTPRGEEPTFAAERRKREQRLAGSLSKLDYLRAYLKPHAPKKKALEAMFNPKLLLTKQDLEDLQARFDVDTWYKDITSLEGEIRSSEAEIARKEGLATELSHWSGLGARVEDVADTHRVRVSLLRVEASAFDGLSRELSDEVTGEVLEVSRSGASMFAAALYLREDEAAAASAVKRHGARAVDLSGAAGRPDEAAGRLRSEADGLRERIDELRARAASAASGYDQVLALHDETAELLAKATVEERFARTRDTSSRGTQRTVRKFRSISETTRPCRRSSLSRRSTEGPPTGSSTRHHFWLRSSCSSSACV